MQHNSPGKPNQLNPVEHGIEMGTTLEARARRLLSSHKVQHSSMPRQSRPTESNFPFPSPGQTTGPQPCYEQNGDLGIGPHHQPVGHGASLIDPRDAKLPTTRKGTALFTNHFAELIHTDARLQSSSEGAPVSLRCHHERWPASHSTSPIAAAVPCRTRGAQTLEI